MNEHKLLPVDDPSVNRAILSGVIGFASIAASPLSKENTSFERE